MYIFFGSLLFKLIVEYSSNLKWLYLTLPIASSAWIKDILHGGQVSLAFSIGLGVLIYLALLKEYRIFFFILSVIGLCVVIDFKWICMKWVCRPYIWIELMREWTEHPFVGSGFNKYFIPDNVTWIRQIGTVTYGWLYRHNDPLSIGAFLGSPILIPLFMFLKDLFHRFKRSVYVIPFMAFLILCCFQITFFRADKALIVITSTALFYTKT